MMHFENYHWEDHVPRKGGWKFNLALGALAFGLIAAALPERPGDGAVNVSASPTSTAAVNMSAVDTPRRAEPVALRRKVGGPPECPTDYVDS